MLTLLVANPQNVPVKNVEEIPPGLYWYMGAIILICAVAFFVLPLLLSKRRSRPIPPQDATTDDHHA